MEGLLKNIKSTPFLNREGLLWALKSTPHGAHANVLRAGRIPCSINSKHLKELHLHPTTYTTARSKGWWIDILKYAHALLLIQTQRDHLNCHIIVTAAFSQNNYMVSSRQRCSFHMPAICEETLRKHNNPQYPPLLLLLPPLHGSLLVSSIQVR